jgi:hypothetical protein
MKSELVTRNAVVTAQRFNPSIFSQIWLVKNNVVGETDFRKGSLFSDDVVKVETPNFSMLVLPQQVQVVPRSTVDTAEESKTIEETVGRIVHSLPETPFVALGLNFNWQVWSDASPFLEIGKRLFYRDGIQVLRHFNSDDAKYGTYASKNVLGFRLKLTVLPVDGELEVDGEVINQSRFDFGFNFHFDIPGVENRCELVSEQLSKWHSASVLAKDIVAEFAELEQ